MPLGWPLTGLLVIGIVGVFVAYIRADRDYERRKLEIVQKRLAAIEARKKQQVHAEQNRAEQNVQPEKQ